MFIACTVILIICFALVTLAAPFRLAGRTSAVLDRARTALLAGPAHAVFTHADGRDDERLLMARVWGVLSSVIFLILLMRSDAPFTDHPGSLALVLFAALSSMVVALGSLTAMRAFTTFLPRWRAFDALSRFGFRALWIVDPKGDSNRLRQGLATRVLGSSRVGIMDVTGFELIGKGQGPNGGLLFDTLVSATGVPVSLLLLQPDTQALDPEGRRATVFQTVLSEMDVSPQTFVRRVRSTLEAIETLNERRPPEAKIEVRFYNEKPTVRALLFDETGLISPWVPREGNTPFSVVEIAREAQGVTLFEPFRSQFARLWNTAIERKEAASKANGFKSSVVPRKTVAAAAT